MFKRSLVCLLAIVGVLMFGQAKALDDAAIDRWLTTMEELQAWGDRQEELDDDDFQADDPQDFDFEQILAETAREHEEAREIIQRNGYDDVAQWASDGGRIFHAMMAVQMEVSPEMEREMEQAIRELEENPNISEEQKQQFRRQMEQQMERISGMFADVPEEDMATVERRMDDIMAVME